MPKKRITLRIDVDEIAVVGPIQRWQHLIETYKFLANMFPKDEHAWLEASLWVEDAITNAAKSLDD